MKKVVWDQLENAFPKCHLNPKPLRNIIPTAHSSHTCPSWLSSSLSRCAEVSGFPQPHTSRLTSLLSVLLIALPIQTCNVRTRRDSKDLDPSL